MNPNHNNETPAPAAPFLEIGDQYSDDRTAYALPTLNIRLTPDQPAEDHETVSYAPEEHAFTIKGVGVPLADQLARNHALGERAAVMVTREGAGLVRVCFGDQEDAFDAGPAGANPHDFLLLTAFLGGMAGLIGWRAVLKVLHLETLAFVMLGSTDHLRRRARHDPDSAEAASYREACASIEANRPTVADAILRLEAAGHMIGSPEEHRAAKAWALSVLIG